MKSSSAKRRVLGSLLALVLVAGVGATTATAQEKAAGRKPARVVLYRSYNPFWYRYYDPFWDPFYTTRRVVVDPIAYQREKGYREGQDEGEEDAKKGRRANATGHKDFLESNSITFREAFVKGYEDGYREEVAEIREEAMERDGD